MEPAKNPQSSAKTEARVSQNSNRKKARKPKRCNGNFEEFSACTSLHGLQYLGTKERSISERLWWLIMILISMGICGYFIKTLWDKWQNTPVIVTFAESSTPIWQIPFPAVTLCFRTQIMQTKLNITKLALEYTNYNWTDLTEENQFTIRAMVHHCNELKSREMVTNYTDEETLNFLKDISHSKYTRKTCTWDREEKKCHVLTNPVTTDVGFCSTFNGLDSKEIFREIAVQYDEYEIKERISSNGWTLENGYPKNISTGKTFPRRSSSPDAGAGLDISILVKNKDLDYHCGGIEQGYKISLHSPSDFPRMSQEYFIAPLTQQLIVSIKPNMITTSPGLSNYDPERRKCFLPHERYLKYFKIYSQNNCELECLSNYTLQACDCVAYWMPREKLMPVCGTVHHECIKFAKWDLEAIEMKYEHAVSVNNIEDVKKLGIVKNRCNCKPSCTSISYDAEITQSEFHLGDYLKTNNLADNPALEDISYMTLKAFFKKSQFIPSKRSELYGVSDFLANCGGILGLFLGFSILSLVEIVYFLTVRPICSIKKQRSLQEIKVCTE